MHSHFPNQLLPSYHTVRPNTYNSNQSENPPPLPTTMPPQGQVIKTTSTFQTGPNSNNHKREFQQTQSSTFSPGVGQVVTGSRSSTITTSSTLNSSPSASIGGNWQSPRYGSNTIGSTGLPPVRMTGSPNNIYGVSNNNSNNNHHQFTQHYSGNNSFLANERSAAAAAAG